LLVLSGNFNSFSGGLASLMPWISGGATVYAGMKYVTFRDKVSLLRQEGRSRGYLSLLPFESVQDFQRKETAMNADFNQGLQLIWTQPF